MLSESKGTYKKLSETDRRELRAKRTTERMCINTRYGRIDTKTVSEKENRIVEIVAPMTATLQYDDEYGYYVESKDGRLFAISMGHRAGLGESKIGSTIEGGLSILGMFVLI